MSDRHMHITGFLYEDEKVIERFITAAQATGFFVDVVPVRLREGKIRAVAFYSKDLAGVEDEMEMPGIAEKLSGILAGDIDIVSAWDGPGEHEVREHAWFIRGTRRHVAGEVVRDSGELTAGTPKDPGQPPSPEGPEG